MKNENLEILTDAMLGIAVFFVCYIAIMMIAG